MVDHRVGHDLDAGGMTGADHVRECGLVTEASGYPIAHRLVGRPPLRALDVLLGRRDLDEPVTLGAQRVGAGFGHGVEGPLEHRGGDVLGTGWGSGGGGRGRDCHPETGRHGDAGQRCQGEGRPSKRPSRARRLSPTPRRSCCAHSQAPFRSPMRTMDEMERETAGNLQQRPC